MATAQMYRKPTRQIGEADLMANTEINRDNNGGAAYISLLALRDITVKVMKAMGIVDDDLNAAFATKHTLHNMLNTHRMSFARYMANAERIRAAQNEVFRESPDTVFLIVSTKAKSKVDLAQLATRIKQMFNRQVGSDLYDSFNAYGYKAGVDA